MRRQREQAVAAHGEILDHAAFEIGVFALRPDLRLSGEGRRARRSAPSAAHLTLSRFNFWETLNIEPIRIRRGEFA
jgi:hypothetical protein